MKLFIDDERYPPGDGADWHVARSSTHAKVFVVMHGIPNFISFDHDLGGQDTTMNFVNWLGNYMIDNNLRLPADFDFYVHSQNPVGATNLKSKLLNLKDNF